MTKSMDSHCKTNGGHRAERMFEDNFASGTHLVRFTLNIDSYESQSFALAEVWSKTELKWNLLATVPYPLMKVTCKTLPRPGMIKFSSF